jgi:hypothetical protein
LDNTALIGGVVGGVVGLLCVIAAIVAIVVVGRRGRVGANNEKPPSSVEILPLPSSDYDVIPDVQPPGNYDGVFGGGRDRVAEYGALAPNEI